MIDFQKDDANKVVIISERMWADLESKMARDDNWIREAVRLMEIAAYRIGCLPLEGGLEVEQQLRAHIALVDTGEK